MNNIADLAHARELRDQLYAPSSSELARKLPEIGDAIAAECAQLARDPRPEAAEMLAARFHGAAQFAMQLHAALKREAEPNPPAAA